MKPTAELTARLDAILATLREETAAARCTLRIDLPERGTTVTTSPRRRSRSCAQQARPMFAL